MKFLLLLSICFLALADVDASELYHTTNERKIDPRDRTVFMQGIRSYMDSIVFPEVTLSKMPFADAIDWVQHQIPNHVPASVPADRRYGFSIFLRVHPGSSETVSVSRHQATLPEVLDAICAEHDYIWCLEPSILSIVPRAEAFPSKPVSPNAQQRAPASVGWSSAPLLGWATIDG